MKNEYFTAVCHDEITDIAIMGIDTPIHIVHVFGYCENWEFFCCFENTILGKMNFRIKL